MSGKLERFARELVAKAARLEGPQAVEERFGRYRDDPVAFCRDVLGVESATRRSTGAPYQFRVLKGPRSPSAPGSPPCSAAHGRYVNR